MGNRSLVQLRGACLAAFLLTMLLWASTYVCTVSFPFAIWRVTTVAGGAKAFECWTNYERHKWTFRGEASDHSWREPVFWWPYEYTSDHGPAVTWVRPFWIPAFALAACTLAVEGWRRRLIARAVAENTCCQCRYSLVGLPPQVPCPECGTARTAKPIAEDEERHQAA